MRSILNKYFPHARLQIEHTSLILAYAALCTVYLNRHVLHLAYNLPVPATFHNLAFETSVGLLVVLVQILVCLPFLLAGLTKPAVVVFSFIGFITSYFAVRYGIIFDSILTESVFITNSSEISQYFNFNLFANLAFITTLCLLMIFRMKLRPQSLLSRSKSALKLFLGILVSIALLGSVFYKDYASFFRNNRQVKSMVTPIAPLYQVTKHISHKLFPKKFVFVAIGEHARRQTATPARKKIVVLVLGETARADHFSLNGYKKNLTNPQLAQLARKEDIVNFENMTSCGTATATSVPCIFSDLGREKFNSDNSRERGNLLDVAKAAGYKVTWIDNNTGCQGVCARTGEMDISALVAKLTAENLCNGKTCYDKILIDALKELPATEEPQLVVLHTLGSHGPSYHLRYPDEFKKFQPSCDTSELSKCSKEEVINSYDNTILYTDAIVASVIEHLKSLKNADSAMFYVSDHGESLGENGIYLHSLPYFLAPVAQRHVAAVLWTSETFLSPAQKQLVQNKKLGLCDVSHDFVFSSLLTMMGIETPEYKAQNDLFHLDPQTCSTEAPK